MHRSPVLRTLASAALVTSLAVGGLTVAGFPAAGTDSAGPTPGSPDSGDSLFPHMGNGGYDVQSYAIDLRWLPGSHSIEATTTITATATQALSAFNLELAGLTITGITVDDSPATGRRDHAELTVVPSAPIADRSTFTTVVTYSGEPKSMLGSDGLRSGWIQTPDGATALSEPIGAMTWFPVNNTVRDKATYDIRVNVPNALAVASNGLLRGQVVGPSRTTWHWHEGRPMAAYLATVSIGKYRMYRDTTSSGVPLITFIDPVDGTQRAGRRALPRVMAFLEKSFGRYPFETSGVIVDHIAVDYALETQTRPVLPDRAPAWLMVHELAHQWYGDSVSLKDWNDIWLNEGFASYAEWLWQAKQSGRPGFARRYFSFLYDYYGAGSRFWKLGPADPGSARRMFDRRVYERGAMALQALRMQVGSRTFFRILRTWAREKRYRAGTTPQLEHLAEQVSGQQLDHLFHVWLYAPRKPSGY